MPTPRNAFIAVLGAFLANTCLAAAPATRPATAPTTQPFENEIKAFEAADRKQMPAPGGVLFLGSSSIRLWKTLAQDFPGVPVINRGFGGSTIPDSTRYAPRIMLPYKPKTIVFYAGDNDLANGATPQKVLEDFKKLVATVRPELPETRILFIAVKPSPKRWNLADRQREANRLVREFTQTDLKRLGFIDVYTPMLGDDGKPRPELFVEDQLHMNAKGYELWTSIVKAHLQ
jgi:lysophospholipase L1-like esterase